MTDHPLTDNQKKILKQAAKPGSTILFNIKGMIEVLHKNEPFTFVEMGYEDIKALQTKGFIEAKRSMQESHILQGEEFQLTELGMETARRLKPDES